jgi:hypothetical protein
MAGPKNTFHASQARQFRRLIVAAGARRPLVEFL